MEVGQITATDLLKANFDRVPRQVLRVRSLGADQHDRGQNQRIRGAEVHGILFPLNRQQWTHIACERIFLRHEYTLKLIE
jgi:hypothetical protein